MSTYTYVCAASMYIRMRTCGHMCFHNCNTDKDCMSHYFFPCHAIVRHDNQDPHLLSPSGQAQLLFLLPASQGGEQCMLPNP